MFLNGMNRHFQIKWHINRKGYKNRTLGGQLVNKCWQSYLTLMALEGCGTKGDV